MTDTTIPGKGLQKSSSTSSSSSLSSSEGEEHEKLTAGGGTVTKKKKKNIFKRIEEKVKDTFTGHHHGSETKPSGSGIAK